MKSNLFQRLRQKAKVLKADILALWFAYRDDRTPWYAKLWAAMVVGYAFSPIDLIPDPIPILGYLDDFVLVPLGIWIALKLIPSDVMRECRLQSQVTINQHEPLGRWMVVVVVGVWITVFIGIFFWVKNFWD